MLTSRSGVEERCREIRDSLEAELELDDDMMEEEASSRGARAANRKASLPIFGGEDLFHPHRCGGGVLGGWGAREKALG